MVIVSGLFILLPNLPLVPIMFFSQVLNGVALPAVLIFMILLANDPDVMKGYTNGLFLNVVSWLAIGTLICLNGVLMYYTVRAMLPSG